MYIEEIAWQHYQNLPHIARLPLNEQIRMYNMYLMDVSEQRINYLRLQEAITQQETIAMAVAASNGGGGYIQQEEEEDPLPSNCIQFTANTFDDTNFEVIVGTSAETTYTINWGDGNTGDGTLSAEDTQTISHSYENSSQEYTIRLCFADASAVTSLEFEGND
jgi:hypothetical protein